MPSYIWQHQSPEEIEAYRKAEEERDEEFRKLFNAFHETEFTIGQYLCFRTVAGRFISNSNLGPPTPLTEEEISELKISREHFDKMLSAELENPWWIA